MAEASEHKSAFLSNMSHEIRTPINAIIGFSELALKTNLTLKQKNYLSKIKTSSHTLLGLINDVLDLSKIEAGGMNLEIATFNLQEILQNAVNQISIKSQEKGLELITFINEDVPISLCGDSLRLGQIILNLASNAVKFTEKGKISIRVELLVNDGTSTMLQFSVKDTGIGLDKKQKENLFQPFTQADASTTRKYGGTGLGLSISRKLVNLMNGEIWVESELGVGSTFFFTIKIAVDDKERLCKYKKSFEKSEIKILVVDDKEDSRQIIGNMLANISLNVTMSNSGEEAITILEKTKEENNYDLIIMDWKLPGMDGIETSSIIKRLFASGGAPAIILLTAYSSDGVQENAEQNGLLDAVLFKPVTPSLLFNTIIDVCGKESFEQISTDYEIANDTEYSLQLYGTNVLLVEDNEINREVAQEILQGAGMKVTIATNGRDAVDKVMTNNYDIVLMDIQMPIMDGYYATKEIRKEKSFAQLPIIAMTANALISDKEKCLRAGMNDHVTKPIDTTQLFAKIVHWVKKEQKAIFEKVIIDAPISPSSMNKDFMSGCDVFQNLVGIDVQTSLSRLGGNKNLYEKLLMKFQKNHRYIIKEIRNALDQGDLKSAEILTHTIKGASGNLGVQDVYLYASNLEADFKANRVDDVDMLLKQLEQALEQAFDSILLMGKNTEDIQRSHVGRASTSLLIPILEKLERLLHEHDLDAADCVEEIIRQVKNTHFAKMAAKIKDYVDQYNFNGALDILNEMFIIIKEVSKDGK